MLIFIPSAIRGGNEEYALTIAAAGAQRGYSVWVAFPHTSGMVTVFHDLDERGIRCLDLDISEERAPRVQLLRDQHRFFQTLFALLKVRPDVVHMALPWPPYGFGLLTACALLRIPSAVVFQLAPRRFPIAAWRRALCRWARARHQQWIAISGDNQRLLCDSYAADPAEVAVIYNGASRPPGAPLDDTGREIARQDVRKELAVPREARLLITVGRLHAQKGYADLIQAIPAVLATDPDVHFVWVGDGPLRGELTRQLQHGGLEGAVHLLGHRTDVRRLLRAADLFVLPTHFEGGQSFALAEAMSEKLPIVASSASGIPEVIEHGVHGLLFPPGNTAALAEVIQWALHNPGAMGRMAEAACERGAEFSEERMVAETFSVLDRLRARGVT